MLPILTMISKALSGLRQSFFYRQNKVLGNLFGVLGIITMWAWFAKAFKENKLQLKWWVLACLILYTISIIFVCWAFSYAAFDIHLWTYIESIMWALMLSLANYDLTKVAFWSYFFTILFSGLIQVVGFNQPFIRAVMPTDDPAGRWFGLKIFGTDLRIPRFSNGYVRLGMLAFLGIVWAVKSYYKWDWRLLKLLGIQIV